MRNLVLVSSALVSLSLAVGVSGCSAPTDTTQNQMNNAADPNYPAGPYGYVENSTIGDYKFSGKIPVNGDYQNLPLTDLPLGEFHDPSMATKLLLVVGSAGWCYYCNVEAPIVEALSVKYKDKGFRALTVLEEGPVRGVGAQDSDLQAWVTAHDFKETVMAIDPAESLFLYAPASAFPLHILLNTATMKIQWLCVGGQAAPGQSGGCDTTGTIDAAVAAL